MRYQFMNSGRTARLLLACLALALIQACSDASSGLTGPDASPPPSFAPVTTDSSSSAFPATGPSFDPSSPSLDLMITKSMLWAAAVKHNVNPYLVMGLAWHESGWNESAISSAGAVGIMQVMPATAASDGPALLGRRVDLRDPQDNIDVGTAILKNNLDHYGGNLADALVAYYAGGASVTDWNHLRDDERRYVWDVYRDAIMFRDGKGPA